MRKRKYVELSCDNVVLDETIPLPVIHNVVATSKIQSSLGVLDLDMINRLLPFSFYDRTKFAAITIRFVNPNCTCLLFSSGMIVVTGSHNYYDSIFSSLYVAKILRDCMPGERFELVRCDVQNMVAHVELDLKDSKLDLQAMYQRHCLNNTYQKRMFPGLIYRPENSPIVLLLFYSGKLVITGGKSIIDIYQGWSRLWPVVRGFIVKK